MDDSMLSTHCAIIKSVLRDLTSTLQKEAAKPDSGTYKIIENVERLMQSFKSLGDSYRSELESKEVKVIELSRTLEVQLKKNEDQDQTIAELMRKVQIAEKGNAVRPAPEHGTKEHVWGERLLPVDPGNEPTEGRDEQARRLSRADGSSSQPVKDGTHFHPSQCSSSLREVDQDKSRRDCGERSRQGRDDRRHEGHRSTNWNETLAEPQSCSLQNSTGTRAPCAVPATGPLPAPAPSPGQEVASARRLESNLQPSKLGDKPGGGQGPRGELNERRSDDVICLDSDSDEDTSGRASPPFKRTRA